MNVVILAGSGEGAKKTEILKIKRKFSPNSVTTLDLTKNTTGDLCNTISALSLFQEGQRLVIADNVNPKLDLSVLPQGEEALTLVVLTSAVNSSLAKFKPKVLTFESNKELTAFPFLDNLIERKKEAFLELNKLLSDFNGSYVLSMMFYLLRRNILPLPASSFAAQKISIQKKTYQPSDWSKLYSLVLETESKVKSGQVSENLGLTLLTQVIIGGKF